MGLGGGPASITPCSISSKESFAGVLACKNIHWSIMRKGQKSREAKGKAAPQSKVLDDMLIRIDVLGEGHL